MEMKYEMEADWLLLKTCNFRCAYCGWGPEVLGSKLTVHAPPQQWLEGFRATGKTWLLHITGGEPSLYPGFVDLCRTLGQEHYLSINTNLSNASILDFAERMDPARVHYVNAAVHSDERRRKGSSAVFTKHVRALKEKGFTVLASVVMSTAMVKAFPELAAEFEAQGIILLPKAMRGMVEGKAYPAAYTPEERVLIREYLSLATPKYAVEIERMGEPATIDMFADARFVEQLQDYRGRVCGAGYNFVSIEPEGLVVRCGSGQTLGNILKQTVKLRRAPSPCDATYCPYFCEKYTTPEFARKRAGENNTLFDSLSSLAKRMTFAGN